ncbi:hypothetical protein P4U03_02035 [Bacillus mycoides]|uniref:DUF262 domain-containing protein n=1 Tax=Bacillus thuringiensis serovar navarrensis TaxID=339658 RepID=A0A243AQN9_BACTU|nr:MULTISPECIES: hypothetical protein [Bacillus cereus group]MED1265472.1 hypothetical protein [Bacillus mycoides]OTY28620.1 hypothetical protein BK732_03025 [Bacillus thuringiensis serovar navarrensis]
MDVLKDLRVDCFSLMKTYQIKEYLGIIETAYKQKGNIEGQRVALKTKSAITIRNRMKSDIVRGTILPPVVVGIVVGEDGFNRIEKMHEARDYAELEEIINAADSNTISIIDGMQRTTSIMEAINESQAVLEREIRVEFWITKNVNSLLYRMLILNTGQVPWNLKRQIEVVYNPLIKELTDNVESMTLWSVENPSNRTSFGEYQAEKIVELFLVFGTREVKVDTKGALADEFTKLDFIGVTSENQLNELFMRFLEIMIKFDEIVFELTLDPDVVEDEKFKSGKDLFGSQTLKAGFMAAIAQYIFGIPGEEYSKEKQNEKVAYLMDLFEHYFEKLKEKNDEELIEYLDFITLNEYMKTVNRGIGDFERKFFNKAFETLIDKKFELENLTPCWRAAGSK